jgi:hypothetical protein
MFLVAETQDLVQELNRLLNNSVPQYCPKTCSGIKLTLLYIK